jgi:type VI secretion system protein ImpF
MTAYSPGVLERLMGQESAPAGRTGLEQLKDSVARDLEALLNTRLGVAIDAFDAHPEARASILGYGLVDFAAFSLSSSEDRAAICASLKDAIERHEPRLTEVAATFEANGGGVNRLQFTIHARLRLAGGFEPVDFNAVLQPSSLHYTISKSAISKSSRAPNTNGDRGWTST